jgi:UDP-2,3-diacylglucosamine pyrophosphatase LpxH
MLVLISDLHLTDGTSGATISSGAFEIFAERLRDLATAASFRSDGGYRPIDRLDLVLLGDVLDVIRSARWSAGTKVRPWDPPGHPALATQVAQITADILAQNEPSLAMLRGLAAEGLGVPPADGRGRPVHLAAPLPVPVHVHYMVGNHDWFFHLPGHNYDRVRQAVIGAMGLANRAETPFPHDPAESGELLDVMRRHKLFARHGDIFDPFNFEGDRNASSLGDAIVIELLSRFATAVEMQMADDLPPATLAGLREIDNVRPLVLAPVWIDGLLERTCPFPAVRKQVKTIWDRLADNFLSIPFVRERDTWCPVALVDGLERALMFSKRLSLGWASHVVAWLNGLRGQTSGSYFVHALAEQDFRNRRARHIVYGHTHHAESVPLDASFIEGYPLNQVYFNSGTWRRVHRQTELAPAEHEFIASDVMTYLTFFQGDERKGRPYETWSGTLGIHPGETAVHRVDPGRSNHERGQSVSAPALHGHAPHFRPLPARQGAIIPTRRL